MVAPQFGLFTSIAILSLLDEDNVESDVFEEETIFTYIAVLDVYMASTTPLIYKVTNWIINSGYTNYIYYNREDFISYTSLRKAIHITNRDYNFILRGEDRLIWNSFYQITGLESPELITSYISLSCNTDSSLFIKPL